MKKSSSDGTWIVLVVAIAMIVGGIIVFVTGVKKPSPTIPTTFESTPLTFTSTAPDLPAPRCADIRDTKCDVPCPSHLPATIKMATLRFHIHCRKSPDMFATWGMSNYEKETILLNADQPLETMRDTLFHELTHMAIAIGSGREGISGGTEDEFIEASVPMQLEILQDNAGLRKWLGL